MNAVTLEILLHHYYSPERYIGTSNSAPKLSPAEIAGIHSLIGNCLIEEKINSRSNSECEFGITEKGKVHVKKILDLPLPVQSWV